MTWYFVLASLFCGWAVLSVLGDERHRKVAEMDREFLRKPPPAPTPEQIFTVGGPASPAGGASAKPAAKSTR